MRTDLLNGFCEMADSHERCNGYVQNLGANIFSDPCGCVCHIAKSQFRTRREYLRDFMERRHVASR